MIHKSGARGPPNFKPGYVESELQSEGSVVPNQDYRMCEKRNIQVDLPLNSAGLYSRLVHRPNPRKSDLSIHLETLSARKQPDSSNIEGLDY